MKHILILSVLFLTAILSIDGFAQSTDFFFFYYDADVTAPAAPTSPSALGSAGAVAVSWTDPTALDFDSIRVYAGTSTAPTTWVASVVKGTQTYNYTGLTPGGTLYYFRLKAKDQSGNLSDYTSTVQDTVLPVVPTIAVVGDSGKITITNTAIIADSLRIYRGTSANPTTWVYSIAANSTKIDSPLTYNTVYHYRAKALTGSTLSDYSTSVSDTALIALGDELCGNITFDADTWWEKDANITIADGVGHYTAATDGQGLYKTTVLTNGLKYRATFTMKNYSSGNLFRVFFGTVNVAANRNANGTYVVDYTSNGTLFGLKGYSTGNTYDVDDVSIKQILNP